LRAFDNLNNKLKSYGIFRRFKRSSPQISTTILKIQLESLKSIICKSDHGQILFEHFTICNYIIRYYFSTVLVLRQITYTIYNIDKFRKNLMLLNGIKCSNVVVLWGDQVPISMHQIEKFFTHCLQRWLSCTYSRRSACLQSTAGRLPTWYSVALCPRSDWLVGLPTRVSELHLLQRVHLKRVEQSQFV